MHIICYVLDSLRADHLACYGYVRNTSPNIDTLAKTGVLFNRCYSTSTWTRPVAASILSGTYPAIHGVQGRKDIFDSSSIRLPEYLRENGFHTACISGIGNVSTVLGFARGFDYFSDLYKEPTLLKTRVKSSGAAEGLEEEENVEVIFPLAEDLNSFFLPWLDSKKDENTFSLLWSIQTHEPYDPPKEFNTFVEPNYDRRFAGHRDMIRRVKSDEDRKYLIDLYDGEIYYNDYCIGEIIQYLIENQLYENSLLIFLGDHGESLGEHGIFSHGHMPYEQIIRVPLIVKFPHQEYGGLVIDQLVSLMDIFPSISDYMNIPFTDESIDSMKGKSFLRNIREEYPSHQYLYAETRYSDMKPTFQSVISKDFKYLKVVPTKLRSSALKTTLSRLIQEGIWLSILRNPLYMLKRYGRMETQQLFNLNSDPDELHNLSGKNPEVVDLMENLLLEWQTECSRLALPHSLISLNPDDEEMLRQQLRALGYLD